LIRTELPPASLAPLPIALVTVMAMLIGFALPPLLQLKNTPPARVLRKTVTAPPLRYGLPYLCWRSQRCSRFCGAWCAIPNSWPACWPVSLGVGLVLTAAGFGLVRLTGRLRGGVGVAWRYGLANVSRRGNGSVVQIVAFGLGLMVLLLLAVVRGDLLADWRRSLPSNVPNNFLVNISPDERPVLEAFLKAHGLGQPQMYPMVRARMTAINGQPASPSSSRATTAAASSSASRI
jgi:putative ABC transport system permease protein